MTMSFLQPRFEHWLIDLDEQVLPNFDYEVRLTSLSELDLVKFQRAPSELEP